MNSTHNIMVLIEALLADGGEIGVRELASRTGVPKSTVQRFLSSMQDNGWVTQDHRTQGYRIGYKLLSMANSWRLRLELTRQSEDVMRSLCDQSHQTVLLLVQDGYSGICQNKVEPQRSIKLVAEMGHIFPLHAGACGKILLTYALEPLRKHILYSPLPSYTPKTITDPKILQAEIDKIRALCYATSVEEMTVGAAEISVPLLNADGSLIAALSIAGTKFDVEPQFVTFEKMLRTAAQTIVERLENN